MGKQNNDIPSHVLLLVGWLVTGTRETESERANVKVK